MQLVEYTVGDFSVMQMALGPMKNLVHLLAHAPSCTAVVVDPAWDTSAIISAASQHGWRIVAAVCTHSHADHVNGVEAIVAACGVQVHMLAAEAKFSGFDASNLRLHPPAASLDFGPLHLEVLHTPGHTPGSATFWHAPSGSVFTGDTLFVDGCGRCDLPGGDAEAMFASLHKLRNRLPQHATVYPGHDYAAVRRASLAQQLISNPYLRQPDLRAFVALRMPAASTSF